MNFYCFYFSEINNNRLYANKWNENACCDWAFKNCTFSQSWKIHKIHKELEKENDNAMSVSKCKKHSTHSDTMRTHKFIHNVKQTIDENWGQSMRSIVKMLHVSEKRVRRNVHEDIRYKSYVMKRGNFISEKSKENRLNRSKRLLNKLKNPTEARMDRW